MEGKVLDKHTADVIATFEHTENARLKEILTSLVKHLHAFVRDVNLTEAEWLAGIQFLNDAGHISDERRQEFILLSDTLGVSTLKDLLNNQSAEGMTEWSLLGPFYRAGAADFPLGANIAENVAGEPVVVSGRVLAADGTPIAGALLDVWQSDAEGFYDLQKMGADEMSLRGRFRTDETGAFVFRTIKPSFYPIPADGPVGKMLRAVGRHPFRPAHIHFQISAEGYRSLTTELYANDDKYLESDSVFGVRPSLIVQFEKHESAQEAAEQKVAAPFYTLHYDFVMERA